MDDGLISDLLTEIKSRNGYPPQSFAQAFLTSPTRSKTLALTMRNVPEHAGRYCLGLLNEILKEFTEMLLMNPTVFGLSTDTELRDVVFRSVEAEFISARGRLAQEFQTTNEGKAKIEAMSALDEGHGTVVEDLRRKIRLRATKTSSAQNLSIQITDSQNINVVLGSVNTSIQNLIDKGGAEKTAARLIQDLVDTIKDLEEKHEKEKRTLLKLAEGLAKEIEKEPETRNPSVMQAILDRIKTVGSTVSTAVALHKFITEVFPQLARLLGIDE